MRAVALAACLLGVGGCATTGKNGPDLSGAQLTYVLPETSAKVRLDLVVTKCADYNPTTGQLLQANVVVRPTTNIHVAAEGGTAAADRYTLTGAALSSWTENRDIQVDLYPTGAIKSVNSTAADRTAAAVTNILKGVTSLLSIVGAPERLPLACKPATLAAAREAELLDKRVTALSSKLPGADPKAAAEITKAIEVLVAEIGRLRASDLLRAELPETAIDLNRSYGEIAWPTGALSKLLQRNDGKPLEEPFAVAYCAVPAIGADPEAKCFAQSAPSAVTPAVRAPADCGADPACSHTLVLREPQLVLVSVLARGDAFGDRKGKVLKAATLPATQRGQYSYLSFAAGAGGSRTIKLSLDEFGRRTSFGWKSDSRLETLTGSAAGALDAAANLKKAADGQSVASMKAEIDELETQQKLNKLNACREIILAGGYKCEE